MADQRDGGISWCDETWNPIRGCSRVSAGCENCYAERVAARFSGPGAPYEGLARIGKNGARWTGDVRLVPEHLKDPWRWRRPRRVFVNSMSDLFHEGLTNDEILTVFSVMAAAPRHTFQILTKRAKRMHDWFAWVGDGKGDNWPLPNVWLGVSAEDQATADERIPFLLETPAAVRWVSYEPALADVDFFAFLKTPLRDKSLTALHSPGMPGLDWLVIGGESGPGARPFDLAWARSVVEQCKASGTACFVKQLGARPIHRGPLPGHEMIPDNVVSGIGFADRKGGDMSEWPVGLRVREFPR